MISFLRESATIISGEHESFLFFSFVRWGNEKRKRVGGEGILARPYIFALPVDSLREGGVGGGEVQIL